MNGKYVFMRVPGGASPTGYSVDSNGVLTWVGFTVEGVSLVPGGVYQAGKVLQKPNLATLMQPDQFKNLLNSQKTTNSNNMNTQKPYNGAAIIPVETPQGMMTEARDETQYSDGGEIITLNVSLDYTAAAGADPNPVNVLIGDGTGIIANKLGLPALPASLVVGGTFGTATLSLIKQMSLSDYIRIHTYQGEANNAIYWSTGIPAQTIISNIQGSLTTVNVDFNLDQDGSQFNEKIRRIGNFRFILATFTAIKQSLAWGDKVNLTFRAQSLGSTRGMQRVK